MVDYDKKYFIKDGRGFVLRFFDCENSHDLRDLVMTVESPEVQRWMDNVQNLSFVSYRKWMDEKGESDSFLFAIADPRDITSENRVHGFIYVYPSKIESNALEVSYAKRPGAPAGLVAPALQCAFDFVRDYLEENRPHQSRLKFLAEIEMGNTPSIRVVEKAGFRMISGFDSHKNALWAKFVETKGEVKPEIVEALPESKFKQLGRVRQLNNSYCGPASLQFVLSHLGIVTDQEKIVAGGSTREHATKNGMSLEMLAASVRNLYPEVSLWAKREADLFDLEKMVREYNYPVVVDWQGYFEASEYKSETMEDEAPPELDDPMLKGDNGHYSVIIDVDRANNYIRIMDPYGHYAEQDRFFGIQDFLSRWWDDRMDKNLDGSKKYVYENRLMFVVVPKNVRLPEELGMKAL